MAKRKRSDADLTTSTTLDKPLPKDGVGSVKWWTNEIEASEKRLADLIPKWRQALAIYDGAKFSLFNVDPQEVINVNVPFYTAEGKQPNLFYQTPFIQLESEMPETDEAAPVAQAALNKKLGRTGANAGLMMDRTLKNLLVTSGIGVTKIGYERVEGTRQVPKMVPQIDPMTRQEMRGPDGRTIMTQAVDEAGELVFIDEKFTIYDQIYWKDIDPTMVRLPVGFTSTDYEAAPWQAWLFPLSQGLIREHGLDESGISNFPAELIIANSHDKQRLMETPYGIEIFYKASLFDPEEPNPLRIRQLVIVPGRKSSGGVAIVHRDLPWQMFDDDGRFKAGMQGFPLHIFTLRDAPQSCYPRSDADVLSEVGREKTEGRTLMVQQRRRNLPMVGINKTTISKDLIDQIEKGKTQTIVLFDGPVAESDMRALERANFPVENFEFDRIAQQDIDRLAASGANQQGLPNVNSDTATEASLIQRSVDNRLSKERDRVLETFLAGAEKFFALMQLFSDQDDVVRMVGPTGAQQLMTWNKNKIQGRFGFSLKPDSSNRVNAAESRNEWLRLVNTILNAPVTNQLAMVKETIKRFNENPATLTQPPPEPPKEGPRVSVSFSISPSEDLNPANPAYANVLNLLRLAGIELPSQPEQPPVESPEGPDLVNKHESEITGGIPGAGVV